MRSWFASSYRFRLRRSFCAVVLGVLLGQSAPCVAQDLVLAVSRTALSLPIYVADAQGYFAAQGLNIRLEECIGGSRCIRRLLDGAVGLATASELPVMFNSFERADYALVATFVTSASDIKLIARRSAGISSASHLLGKRIATVKGTSAHYFLDAFLLFNGIDPKQVHVVSLPPEKLVSAFHDRAVDALAIWEPYGWMAIQTAGNDAVILPSPKIYTESFNLIASRLLLREREEDVVRVLRALAKAQKFIAQRPREAQNILKQRLSVDEAFIAWVWKDLDYRLALDQSLITTLEAEARWALREGHVPSAKAAPNYLRFLEPGPLRKAEPDNTSILR